MGMCKECGEVFSSVEMIDGVCQTCRNPKAKLKKQLENKQKQDALKKILNSKFFFEENELKDMIGVGDFFQIRGGSYMGGVDEIDTLMEQNKTLSPDINFRMHSEGISIAFTFGVFESRYLAIPYKKITTWTIEEEDEIIKKVDKSVIGRALLGGLLLGPLGAMVGGMSGIGTKDMPYSPTNNNVLTLFCNLGGIDTIILFAIKKDDLSIIRNYFMLNFSESYKNPDDIKLEKEEQIIPNSISHISVADELKKLKELTDDGILTKEEFDAQKYKLLNM